MITFSLPLNKFIITCCLILSVHCVFSQQWAGISGSNYAGIYSVHNNPANVVDSRYKLFLNIAGNDVFEGNNYFSYNAPFPFLGFIRNSVGPQYRNAQGKIIFKDSYIETSSNGAPYHSNTTGDAKGPSIIYTINNKSAIAAYTRLRYAVNLNGINNSLADLITRSTNRPGLIGQKVDVSESALNANVYAEMGLTYGHVLMNNEENFFKFGVTVKRVIGLYNVHIIVDKGNYEIVRDNKDPNRNNIQINSIQGSYGYTTDESFKNAKIDPQWALGGLPAGSGFGLDLGFVYEYRPDYKKYIRRSSGTATLDPTQNKYEFKLGVSLLDFGSVRYNNGDLNYHFEMNQTNRLLTYQNFQDLNGYNDAFQRINNSLGLNNREIKFSSSLPTTLQVNFDYHIRGKYYVNTMWSQSLRKSQSIGMTIPSSFSVTPRMEHKWYEIAVPISLLDNYNIFTMGLAGRAGPVFMGSDNLPGLLSIGKPRGLDFYFGVFVPVFRKPPSLPNACWYEIPEKRPLKDRLMFWKKRKY